MIHYGLVQSVYLCFSNQKAILKDFSFSQSKYNNILFYDTLCSLYIIVCVDNIKAFCINDATISRYKKIFSQNTS